MLATATTTGSTLNNNAFVQPFGFTRSLRQALVTSQSQLTEWVEEQKAIADAAAAVQQAEMAECQSRVDQLVANLLALEMERDWSVRESADEQVLEDQQKSIQNDIDRLNEELASTQTRMQELNLELKKAKEKAMESRKLKQDVETSKVTTVDDLTRGIVNYKYLGLDFEKAGDDQLRFCFTQVDPNNPSRRFWFDLEAKDELWNITDCEPSLDLDLLNLLVNELDKTDDMHAFVQAMRKAFVQLVDLEHSSSFVSPPPSAKHAFS